MGITGLRAHQVASRFEAMNIIGTEDFANFTEATVSDSDLKYVWMLEKTEVRKIREACALAREDLGLGPYVPKTLKEKLAMNPKMFVFGKVSTGEDAQPVSPKTIGLRDSVYKPEETVVVDGLLYVSNPTLDFVRDRMRIGGLRTQHVASRFEKLGIKTDEGFANFTEDTVSDSDLKYVWMLEKTEVRKIREGCESIRQELGMGPSPKKRQSTIFGRVVNAETEQLDARTNGLRESTYNPEEIVVKDGLVFKENAVVKYVDEEMRIGGLRTQHVASRFEKLGYAAREDFAAFDETTVSDSDLKYVWMLEKTEVRKIREACEAMRLELGVAVRDPKEDSRMRKALAHTQQAFGATAATNGPRVNPDERRIRAKVPPCPRSLDFFSSLLRATLSANSVAPPLPLSASCLPRRWLFALSSVSNAKVSPRFFIFWRSKLCGRCLAAPTAHLG